MVILAINFVDELEEAIVHVLCSSNIVTRYRRENVDAYRKQWDPIECGNGRWYYI